MLERISVAIAHIMIGLGLACFCALALLTHWNILVW